MGLGRTLALSAGLAGAGVGSVVLAGALDRRKIKADPNWPLLSEDPEGGRVVDVIGPGGVPIHTMEWGDPGAPPIVLIHGWTCAIRFWRRQLHDLSGDYRVIAYDARGHGESGTPEDGDWSLDTLADDLEAVLDATVGETEKVLLAGHSMGAMTIAAWAGRHPENVGRRAAAAALLNTGLDDVIMESLLIKSPQGLDKARQAIGGVLLGATLPLPANPDPITHRVVRYVALSPSATHAEVWLTEEMTLNTPPRVRGGCGRELSRMAILDRLEHLTVPTLIIAGEKDRLTPPVHAERMHAALPNPTELLVLEDSGHMGPLERAHEVNTALRALAREHLGAEAATAA